MDINSPSGTGAEPLSVPVLQERVELGKSVIDTGRGVRLHKTVSETAHPVEASLQHEALEVQRVAVDTIVPLSEAPVARQEGDTLIVPVLEEVLVLEKRLRIKEEIHITRTTQAHPHAESVVLRSEQVSVERFDEGTYPGTDIHTRR